MGRKQRANPETRFTDQLLMIEKLARKARQFAVGDEPFFDPVLMSTLRERVAALPRTGVAARLPRGSDVKLEA